MAQREIRIPIVGDSSQLKRELAKAERDLDGFGGNAKKIATDFKKEFLLLGAGIAAGLGIVVKTAADFDKQMSEVGAVAGASAEELDTLREAAIKAGAATVFSAGQAAEAQAELAKAGVSTADILSGGLTGALDLASAGSIGLGDAAMYAANAMNTFGLSGSDVPEIADTLAASANKSAASVDDMGQALQQSGQVASQTGLNLQETTAVLSLFAQAGLKGSDAGTSLKTTLLRLNPSTKEAAGLMADLGLRFYDAQGRFVGISTVAQQLKEKLGPLSDEQRTMALNTIFGTDAIRGATVLMNAGAGGVTKWTNAVSDTGYAADLAAKKTDNLSGDLEQLRGSLETALIRGGSQATTVLRGLTQGFTDVVNGVGELPGPVQAAFLGAAGIIGVGSAAVGVYGTLAPKIEKFKETLESMGSIGPKIAGSLGTIGIAAGGATVALGLLTAYLGDQAAKQAAFNAQADAFKGILEDLGGATDELNVKLARAFADKNIGKLISKSGIDVREFTDAVRDSGTELDKLTGYTGWGAISDELQKAADSGQVWARSLLNAKEAGKLSGSQVEDLVRGLDYMNDTLDSGAEKLAIENQFVGDLTGNTGSAATESANFADQQLRLAQNAEDAAKALEKQNDAILALAGGDVAYRQSQIRSKEAIDDYNATMKDGKKTALERQSAGQDLIDAFLAESSAAVGLASDMKEAAGEQLSQKEAADIQRVALENLRDTLAPGNPLRLQLQGYIDKLGEIPEQKSTFIAAATDAAIKKVQELIDKINSVPLNTTVSFDGKVGVAYGPGVGNALPSTLGRAPEHAAGGMVADGWFSVGEKGPELGRKRGSSVEIFSNAKSQQMVKSGGDSVVNNFYGHDPAQVLREQARMRRKQVYLAGAR